MIEHFSIDPVSPPATVLVAGADQFFHAQYLKRLRDLLRENHEIYDMWCLDTTKSGEVKQELDSLSLPFMPIQRRAVFVWSVQRVSDRNSKLIQYLESPNSQTTAVFVVDVGASVSGKFLTQLSTGTYFNAKPLEVSRTKDEVSPWVKRRFESQGIICSAELCQTLHQAVGTDLFNLDSEIRKLTTYCRGRGQDRVAVEDIAAVVEQKVYPSVFDICNTLLTRNPKQAMQALHQHFAGSREAGDTALAVIGALARSLITWSLISMMTKKNRPFEEIASVVKLPQYVVEKVLFPKLKKFGLSDFFRWQARLCEVDYAAKQGADARLLLDLFVLDFCGLLAQERHHAVYSM